MKYGLIIGIVVLLICMLVTIVLLIKYILDTRDEDTKYKSEKRKILMAYGGAIDVIEGYELNLEEYSTIKVNKFIDLIKIKEDISQPILALENEEKTNTIFFIPNNTKFMYIFVIGKEREMLAEKNEIKEKEFETETVEKKKKLKLKL